MDAAAPAAPAYKSTTMAEPFVDYFGVSGLALPPRMFLDPELLRLQAIATEVVPPAGHINLTRPKRLVFDAPPEHRDAALVVITATYPGGRTKNWDTLIENQQFVVELPGSDQPESLSFAFF